MWMTIESSFGQSEDATLPHYIIGLTYDTVRVDFVAIIADTGISRDSLSDKATVHFDGRSVELRPAQLRGIYYQGEYYASLSYRNDTATTSPRLQQKFCKRLSSDIVSVFDCQNAASDDHGSRSSSTLFFEQNEQHYPAAQFRFRLKMLASRFPALWERLGKEEIQQEDFLSLIQEYNNLHKPKTSH